MVLEHDIFNKPLKVNLTLKDEIDPNTKKPIKAWLVHQASETLDYGVVTSRIPITAENEKNFEIISGGVNSRQDNGVALVRDENFFLWGFAAPPALMTEEARQVFVNTVCYMKQFKQKGENFYPNQNRKEDL